MIAMGEVERYVTSKGWRIHSIERIAGKPNLVLDCPLCGAKSTAEKRRFYIVLGDDKRTGWICNECGEHGNLYQLKAQLGDIAPVAGSRPAVDASGIDLSPMAPRPAARDPRVVAALEAPPQVRATVRKPIPEAEEKVTKWTRDLLADPEMLAELKRRRRFDPPEIEYFRLGLSRTADGRRWLAIPYLENGKVVLVKYRSLDGAKSFRRWPADGRPAPLYGVDDLAGQSGRVYLCEGEIDRITLIVAYGLSPVVSLPNGAKDLTDEHAAALERFDEIVIITDNDGPDGAGNRSASLIADRLGRFRCSRVLLPRKDASECWAGNAGKGIEPAPSEDVSDAIRRATGMGDIQIMTLADVLERAFSPTSEAFDLGVSSGFMGLDRVIGGFRRREWTVISGPTGAGKTQLQLGFCTSMAVGGWPVLEACLELDPEKVAIRQASQVIRRPIHGMPIAERSKALAAVSGLPIYIVDHKGVIPMDRLLNAAEHACRRYGIKGLSVDHLNFVVPDPDDYETINKAIVAFDAGVTRLHVHGFLGAHPRKVETDPRAGLARPVTMNDIRGSGHISQLAHNVIIVRKATKRADRDAGKGVLAVEKKRWEGSSVPIPALVPVRYDKHSLAYVDDDTPEKPEGVTGSDEPEVDHANYF